MLTLRSGSCKLVLQYSVVRVTNGATLYTLKISRAGKFPHDVFLDKTHGFKLTREFLVCGKLVTATFKPKYLPISEIFSV